MKNFDEFYAELQNNNNDELNNAWKEAKKSSEKAKKISLVICVIIDVFVIIILLKRDISIALLIPALIINLFVVAIVNMIFTGKNKYKYNQIYKQVVVKKIMNNFYNSLEYFPQKAMPEYIYRQLQYEYYDNYMSEDYMEAQIENNNSIQMAEVETTETETYTDSKGETQTRTVTKFHGLFAKIIMEKSINSELKIMQDKAMMLDKGRLKMDSSEFEKHFDVKASDKIIGMQILTADIMEELVQFEEKTKMKFDINIKGNELYLRFHSGPMFEAGNLKNGVLDEKTTKKYFYMLNFTYNLSKKLINVISDLNI